MKLADLRKLSIRKNLKIRFQLRNGSECVITEHGMAQVPALRSVPDFNLEEELAETSAFILEPAGTDKAEKKAGPKPQAVGREELVSMIGSPAGGPSAEHEEE
jgi:hypothetical protein